jgi:glycosyltransferase involved in cell wall biosynthesis
MGNIARPAPGSILFLIRSLNLGGSERQLIYLARGLHGRGWDVTVAIYYSGVLDVELEEEGIRLVNLRKSGRWDLWGVLWRLVSLLRRVRPEAVYSFLGTANILATMARPCVPHTKWIWSIRSSNVHLSQAGRVSALSYRVERVLSRFADLIISNSQAGLDYAAAHGFPRDRMFVVPNGVDTERFRPNPEAGAKIRRSWGIENGRPVIGMLARIDPMKGHPVFLAAASIVAAARPDVRFVCAGAGAEEYVEQLRQQAGRLGIGECTSFPGGCTDPVPVLNAFDLCCSSSYGEGFSNSVAEAMACGVPCVVTDVGDSALIVGSTGKVVPPDNPEELAKAILELLRELDAGVALEPRKRILESFSLTSLVEATEFGIRGLDRQPTTQGLSTQVRTKGW